MNPYLRFQPSHAVTPFWLRLPHLLLYPLLPPAILLLLLTAGLLTFLLLHPSWPGLAAGVIAVAVGGKYGYEALAFTARGSLAPPPLNGPVIADGYGIFFKQAVIFLLLGQAGLLLFEASRYNPVVVWLWSFAVALTLPAMVMVLAVERRLLAAVNPLLWGVLIARLGWRYLVLLGLLFGLNLGLQWLLTVILGGFSASQTVTTGMLFIALFAVAYYLLLKKPFHERNPLIQTARSQTQRANLSGQALQNVQSRSCQHQWSKMPGMRTQVRLVGRWLVRPSQTSPGIYPENSCIPLQAFLLFSLGQSIPGSPA